MKDAGLDVVEIEAEGIPARVAATREAMVAGGTIIFQARLQGGDPAKTGVTH